MHYTKPSLSIDQKISLLEERGLVVDDRDKLEHFLIHIGYFRLTGYVKYFQDEETDMFQEGVDFSEVLDVYMFDRELRLLTLDAIEKIEISVKAIISDYMCNQYEKFRYIDRDNFTLEDGDQERQAKKEDNFNKLQQSFVDIKETSRAVFIDAYNDKYTDEAHLPSWMLFEEMTLGQVSTIYGLMNESDKKEISKIYDTYFGDLAKWIRILNGIRNTCAHHGRLRNRVFTNRPRIRDVTLGALYQIRQGEGGRQEVMPNYFNMSLIVDYMLRIATPNNTYISSLETLFEKCPNLNKEDMGFEDDRKDSF